VQVMSDCLHVTCVSWLVVGLSLFSAALENQRDYNAASRHCLAGTYYSTFNTMKTPVLLKGGTIYRQLYRAFAVPSISYSPTVPAGYLHIKLREYLLLRGAELCVTYKRGHHMSIPLHHNGGSPNPKASPRLSGVLLYLLGTLS
jgi:hypothetical protein